MGFELGGREVGLALEEAGKVRGVGEVEVVTNLGNGAVGVDEEAFGFDDEPLAD